MKLFFVVLLLMPLSLFAQRAPMSADESRRDLFSSFTSTIPSSQDVDLTGVSSGKKNVAIASLYSLLLPGMGELYAGDYGTGKYFTVAEGLLWITLGSIHLHANSMQDDARRFAAQHAATSFDGKDDQYFIDISNFNNVYDFNEQALRDRDPQDVYDPRSAYYWQWDSDANRETFRGQRISSDNMFNNTRFVAAAIAVNHVVSAINAARVAISHNKRLEEAGLLDIRAKLLGSVTNPDGIMISFSKTF
jgi:TM2 domain-containing membrane protein YozV